VQECVFVNSALKVQCHFVKNTLLQIAFSAILPTGENGDPNAYDTETASVIRLNNSTVCYLREVNRYPKFYLRDPIGLYSIDKTDIFVTVLQVMRLPNLLFLTL